MPCATIRKNDTGRVDHDRQIIRQRCGYAGIFRRGEDLRAAGKGLYRHAGSNGVFPEGGGQGADHGTLDGVQVLDAHEAKGEVEHLVSGPLAVGSEVHGHVDAVRRMDMMQQHSGEHMFSGLVHGLFGYDNVGFHIGTEAVTMDFNGMLTEADVRRVELLANQAVWRDQPVEAFVPSREELANIEYRSKKEIAGDVRIGPH